MAGLGILSFLVVSAIAGISKLRDDTSMYQATHMTRPDGYTEYWDSKGRRYINGELTEVKLKEEPDGMLYSYRVGTRSGRLYDDTSYQNQVKKVESWDEKNKQEHIKNGDLAYMRYNFDKKRNMTCEISTGKFIAKLTGDEKGVYRKFYYVPTEFICDYDHVAEGDEGIIITQEEYDKLNIFGGTHHSEDRNRMELVWTVGGKSVRWSYRKKPLVAYEDLPPVPENQ